MKASDYAAQADLIDRVVQRVKALPEINMADPQAAILAVLQMMAHEYRHAHEIMPVDPE